jgi:hypothetical protein
MITTRSIIALVVALLCYAQALSAAKRPGCWDDLVRKAGTDTDAAAGLRAYSAQIRQQGLNETRAAQGLLTVPKDKLIESLRGAYRNRDTPGFNRWAKEAEQQPGKARSGAVVMRLSDKDLSAVNGVGSTRTFHMKYEEFEVGPEEAFDTRADAMLFGKTFVEVKAFDWNAPLWRNMTIVRTKMEEEWLRQLTRQREMVRLAQGSHLLVFERPMPADVLSVFNDVFKDFLSQDRSAFYIVQGVD